MREILSIAQYTDEETKAPKGLDDWFRAVCIARSRLSLRLLFCLTFVARAVVIHVDWIWNHHRNTPLGVSLGLFLMVFFSFSVVCVCVYAHVHVCTCVCGICACVGTLGG